MEAKRIGYKEISDLSEGDVIWCELHDVLIGREFDLPYDVPYYEIFPMMVSKPGYEGIIGWCTNDGQKIVEITQQIDKNDSEFYWDRKPKPEQIEKGIPKEEAERLLDEQDQRSNIILFPIRCAAR